MGSAVIDVHMIRADDRIRKVTPATVAALADSIAEVGLLNPITVYPREIVRNGQLVPGFGLIAGAHRLEAFKALGLVEIECNVIDNLNDHQRIIAECDENLLTGLTPSERADFTARRKAAYIALHPETAHGSNQHTRGDANSASPDFATDQAAKTGSSKRTVQADAERGEKIGVAALAMVRGTPLDTGVYLDKLKAVKLENQCEKVKRDLDALNKPKPKPPVHAPDPEDDYAVTERQVAALMNAWNKAGKEAREAFMDRIGGAA